MALNVTAPIPDPTISAQSIVQSAKSNFKIPSGLASEHICISGDESGPSDVPTIVGKRFRLFNPVRGLLTEFTFFNEGFLKVRAYRKRKLVRDYLLELRFMDPKPAVIRRVVMQTLWTALGLAGAASITWVVAKFTTLDTYLLPTSIILATAAIVALLLFIYQSGEKTQFCTASGNVPVLVLLTSFGCYRQCRRIVPEISREIAGAIRNNTLDEEPYLRAEMQDHYRLRNEGVITPKACSAGTARILTRFG
jgi:hypothetical protein